MSDTADRLVQGLIAQMQRNNGYQARAEIERILADIRQDPKRLEPFGFKVYSQNDEDGILEEIFRRLGVERGRFVEIGVENGLECNTLYLLHKGWRGAWVEGDPKRKAEIEAKFGSILDRRLVLAMGMVTAENVNRLFSDLGATDDLDLISIDIDGNDIYLLETMQVRPKVICIEYNAKFPGHLSKRPVYDPKFAWRGTDYAGSSLKAIAEAAQAKGYRLVSANVTGANAFFVREDLAGDLFPDDASPEHLYHPPRYWLWLDYFMNVGHRADFGPYVDLMTD
ncbi:hypothetical protein [Phenylobacterium sp.]|uniref:hypothetical protein n=1 Tax=Phenylobacterium sp. TaxID=1871053 RepID=UPI0025CE1600|nr:hypothetical protein [Phenylobacterium sp.]